MKILSNLVRTACTKYLSTKQSVEEIAEILEWEAKELGGKALDELKERMTRAEEMMLGYIETGNAADTLRRYSDRSGEEVVFTTHPSIIRAQVANYTAPPADRPYFERGMDLYKTIHPGDNRLVERVCDRLDPRHPSAWVGPVTISSKVARG